MDFRKKLTSIKGLPKKIKNMNYKENLAKIKTMPKKKLAIIYVCGVTLIVLAITGIAKMAGHEPGDKEFETAKAERRTILKTVSSSSVVEANDTYNVTALVTGEIMTDTFNEGDIVRKDDVLYTIESSDAQNALEKARQSFTDAVKKRSDTISSNSINKKNTNDSVQKALNNLQTAKTNYNNLTIRSDYTGTVTEVLVNDGDSVGDGTKLAKIENTSRLEIQLPFNESDAGSIGVGNTAELTLAKSGGKLWGTVTQISSASVATTSHAIVRYVTIEVKNPGALTAGEMASAVIGNVACSDLGTFKYCQSGYITAKTSGKIGDLYLDENDYITSGQMVGYITSDSVTNSYKNAQMDLDSAYRNLEKIVIESDTYALDSSVNSARISLEEAEKNLEDYTIKAPIDGTIITKNKKAGEKLEQGTQNSEPMAIIYDMSVLKVQLTIDESDIHSISTGQKVTITADAAKGEFVGEVTKVGIDGTSSNGVTTYPVEVSITEYGDLLPGMNVDCTIEIESVENVIAVPVGAIQRGNTIYVKGKKTDENDNAPEGYHSVKVETGITDSVFIEIKSGIGEDDEFITAIAASGNEAQGEAQNEAMNAMPNMMGGGGGMPGGNMGGNRGGGNMGGAPR